MSDRICILAAIQTESAALAHALHLHKHPSIELVWNSEQVQLLTIGVKAVQLHALIPLMEEFSPRGIIVAGLGGALDPKLRVADVVVDGNLREIPNVHFHRGAIHTATQIVGTQQAKAELFERTGALAVDMETAVVRHQLEKLPGSPTILAVRSISDPSNMALDPSLANLIDPLGHVRGGAVVKLLVHRPGAMRELMALRWNSQLALGTLAPVIAALVKSPELWLAPAAVSV